MYTAIMTKTSRVLIPYVFFFFSLFLNADARSLVLKNDELGQSQHKETFLRKPNVMTTISQSIDKQDSTFSGATTISSSSRIQELLDTFRRPLSSRATNELDSTSDYKCKRNPTKHHHRRRRYVLQGSNWRKVDLKWSISVFSKKLPHSAQIKTFTTAFRTWAAHCVLTFTYESDPLKADIVIKFLKGTHGDGSPFDDAGAIKAHTFYPSAGGAMHFDEYENWVADPQGSGGISLLSAAIHEIGHSLGLRHSNKHNSVMNPVLHMGRNTLAIDDINGIQQLYGKCTIQNLDAVVTSDTGHNLGNKALVFKNEWVWYVDILSGNIDPHGYPKKIGDLFNSKLSNMHPFKVVLYEHAYKSYLFMRKDVYFIVNDHTDFPAEKYAYKSMHSFFPFLKNTPAPDAGFVDPVKHQIYHFFIGTQYYKFDMNGYKLLSGYPKPIYTEWPGVPSNLDAAFYNYAEKAYYFIKANKYYKLKDRFTKLASTNVGVLTDIFKNICPI